jgi:excisionase family DNA binding protein
LPEIILGFVQPNAIRISDELRRSFLKGGINPMDKVKLIETEGLARIRDAQQFLGLSRSAVYVLLDSGDLASVKIGGARRIRWSDLRDLAAKGTDADVAVG